MKIISHRGFWTRKSEQNSLTSFERAFKNGHGIETDIRDLNGNLVISHDMPMGKCLKFETVLKLFSKFHGLPPLALNIKADGLHKKVAGLLAHYKIKNFFVFDMSIPDMLNYKKIGLSFFSRVSEYESQPVFYKDAKGIWLDEFKGHWVDESVLKRFGRKPICLVSPELHRRSYSKEWTQYRKFELKFGINTLMICTDYPDKAQEFFNGKN